MSEKITTDSEIIGGKPRVKGSRVSVEQIYEMYTIREMSPGKIAEILPTVDKEGVRDAIKYAEENELGKERSILRRAVSGS